jgi:hypothetical protein
MNNEFVPYEEALALKELGFDEKCLMHFMDNSGLEKPYKLLNSAKYIQKGHLKAPLYQQAFRWFRKEHKLHGFVDIPSRFPNGDISKYRWDWNVEHIHPKKEFDSYEEAELACLRKLIEIVQNNE